jgi:hypothetical protein
MGLHISYFVRSIFCHGCREKHYPCNIFLCGYIIENGDLYSWLPATLIRMFGNFSLAYWCWHDLLLRRLMALFEAMFGPRLLASPTCSLFRFPRFHVHACIDEPGRPRPLPGTPDVVGVFTDIGGETNLVLGSVRGCKKIQKISHKNNKRTTILPRFIPRVQSNALLL